MRTYRVSLGFSGYDERWVEADSEEEALAKAREDHNREGFANPSDLMPWPEADTVELEEGEEDAG